MAAQRVSPQHVKERLESDADTVLVCAYDSQEKFQQNHLSGAIPLDAFEQQLDSINKDREIVFY